MIQGVDISRYNGQHNFVLAKKNGISFVLIKAGSGMTGVDPKWAANYEAARAAGMEIGAYWYLYANTPEKAREEADCFIRAIGRRTLSYPAYLDLEDPSLAHLSGKALTDMAIAFLERMESAGFYTGLYSMGSWFQSRFDLKALRPYDKWVAHWYRTSRPDYVAHGMWQYTNRLSCPGIGKAYDRQGRAECDGNYAYRDYPKIIKKAGLNNYSREQNADAQTGIPLAVISLVHEEDLPAALVIANWLFPSYHPVITRSGYFDYEKAGTDYIIGVGGGRSMHTGYLSYFIAGRTMEETLALAKDFVSRGDANRDRYKV